LDSKLEPKARKFLAPSFATVDFFKQLSRFILPVDQFFD